MTIPKIVISDEYKELFELFGLNISEEEYSSIETEESNFPLRNKDAREDRNSIENLLLIESEFLPKTEYRIILEKSLKSSLFKEDFTRTYKQLIHKKFRDSKVYWLDELSCILEKMIQDKSLKL